MTSLHITRGLPGSGKTTFELFDRHARDEYRVLVVLDDRKQVVDMWRSLGLTCLQVAEGNF